MRRVLTVGMDYTGPNIPDITVENFGLMRTVTDAERSAFPLYEYDVIIIDPASYSHFIFGRPTKHSPSDNELWDLKAENNDYDLDNAFDSNDRSNEMDVAIAQGSTVVWCMAAPKWTKFFGTRSVYTAYCSMPALKSIRASHIEVKKGRSIGAMTSDQPFTAYFSELARSGWRACMTQATPEFTPIASTPEGYLLGARFQSGAARAWMVSPPTSQGAVNQLVLDSIGIITASRPSEAELHGIFLSHTGADKPFVRKLRDDLIKAGASMVWVDEAEIQIGDSLIRKIEEGLKICRYVGVVLSPQSIAAPWVKQELEVAMTREIAGGEVVVLPLLYEDCDLPGFLTNKLYADFTDPAGYDEALSKVVRRLKVTQS